MKDALELDERRNVMKRFVMSIVIMTLLLGCNSDDEGFSTEVTPTTHLIEDPYLRSIGDCYNRWPDVEEDLNNLMIQIVGSPEERQQVRDNGKAVFEATEVWVYDCKDLTTTQAAEIQVNLNIAKGLDPRTPPVQK